MIIKQILKFLLISAFILHACTGNKEQEKKTQKAEEKQTSKKQEKLSTLSYPANKTEYTAGEKIEFKIQVPDTINTDSIRFYINNDLIQVLRNNSNKTSLPTENLPVGGNNFRLEVFLDNGQTDVLYKRLTLKSDIKPKTLKCNIIKTYPHDPQAYTQGLFYENGYLYEGTGHRGQSSLRKINLEKGELINSLNLPSDYFGEGVTSFKDKIIQLTWTSRTGFVYDKDEFKLINKVRYPTEGWGITTDGKKLIMSDGSSTIYFLDPEFFSEIGRIEVYDQNDPVTNLNELEYINDKVYANVWQESYIISFNPENGKVLEKIDCSILIPEKYKNHKDNVLNGIAFDSENNRILLTGKRWPKVYHVEFGN